MAKARHDLNPDETAAPKPRRGLFPIVGIGASAGGLEALQQLLSALRGDTGMGFVIVQHLAPSHPSSLTEILARSTKMPVSEVSGEPDVKPDHIYVIPPGQDMIIAEGKLRLLPQERNARHRGIDQFFRSLAEDRRHQAIGVVLSGSATDGTLGLEVIKAEGGVTFAQDDSAQHGSMPKSAVASGCVDFVLPPEGIAQEIARIARHPYVACGSEEGGPETGHGRIAEIVRHVTGVDFTHYKSATIQRRIQRRMMVHKMGTIEEYEEFLRGTPEEVDALYQDLLINVTSFFRDPEAYKVLAQKIFPQLLAGRSRHEPVRLWTLGCSTGEEAYSLAILFTECAEAANSEVQLQMFASDINATSIERARIGCYPRSIAQEVSPERLRKFFVEEDGGYRVNKSLRERVVFSRHNVLADPPFSRMDFISCRNMLIYLEPVLQQQVMPLLHYALKPGGRLWLGSSESLGTSRALFEVEDARQKIFKRLPGPTPSGMPFRTSSKGTLFPVPAPAPRPQPQSTLHRDAVRMLLAKYAPPGVVVNAALEIVQFRGETGAYLSPAAGVATHDLLKMLREGLLVPVRTAISRVQREGVTVREEARVKGDGGFRKLVIEVMPLKGGPDSESGYVVLFDEGGTPDREDAPHAEEQHAGVTPPAVSGDAAEVLRLTQELTATQEYLQAVIERDEAVNEELQSANEEAQSANEELQSINEELETSKEEIQSSNEELATVNDELNNRNNELNTLNNDLTNVLASTQLAIVIVTCDLRIRRFTPMAEKTLNLARGDVGRPLNDIKLSMTIPDLEPLLHEVIDTLSPREREVQDAQGIWFSLRARPYLTHEKKIDGAVVTLVDVDTLRRAREYAETIVANVRTPLVVMDARLRVKTASRAFYTHFQVKSEQTVGRHFYDLGNRQWDIPALRQLLEEVLPQDHTVERYEVRHTFEKLGPRIILVSARRFAAETDSAPLILLSLEDVTETEQAAALLQASEARYRDLFELSPMAVYSCDAAGVIDKFNRHAVQLWGREPAAGNTDEQFCGSFKMFRPDGTLIPHERSPMAEVLSGHREMVRDEKVLIERPDGSRIAAVMNIRPLKNSQGQLTGAIHCFYDVTERHQGDEAQARLAAIVESSEDAIIGKDLQGIIMSWNSGAERLFGYSAAEMMGQPVTVLIPPARLPEEADILAHIAEGVSVEHFETVRRRKDGRFIDVSLTVSPIRERSGRIVGASKIARDITERRLLENALMARAEELARADRSKDEFLAMLAHELRNPLAPLRNAAEILQTEGVTAEEREQVQHLIVRQIENMSRMIDDLLDVSRITQGKIELRKKPVALEAVLTAATSLVRSTCATHGQELKVSLPPEPIYLDADATRLEQVFGNLLSNACKYSGDGCHIVLRAERSMEAVPPEVIISVRDDGIGISPELLPHIFDLFVQATRALDRAHGGLGIGLTLVQRIVKLHDGRIEATSGGLGQGSEFIVHLPILREPPPPPELPPQKARETPRRILIVDDNTDAASSLAMLQRRRGHETCTAFTGPEALTAAMEFKPEVVLLDIGLPGMDGFEVARQLRARPEMKGVLLLAMSGYGSAEDRATARKAGFDDYFVKPVDLNTLSQRLKE